MGKGACCYLVEMKVPDPYLDDGWIEVYQNLDKAKDVLDQGGTMYKGTEMQRNKVHSIRRTECSLAKQVRRVYV